MRIALLAYLRPTERIILGLLTLAMLFMIAPIAFAQTAAGADVTPTVNWGFSLVQGVVVPTLLAVATGITGWLGTLVKKKLGVDAEIATAALNTMLHAGIQRGVDAMEAKFRGKLFGPDGKVVVEVKNSGVSYVVERTAALLPDTLEKLGVDNATLNRLVREAIDVRTGASAATVQKIGTFPAGIV